MAYIPDDAMDRRHTDGLTPAAWFAFETICRYRTNGETHSFVSRETIAAKSGLSLGTVNNAFSELTKKGWIKAQRQVIFLLVGDFSPVLKQAKSASKTSLNSEKVSPNDEVSGWKTSLNGEVSGWKTSPNDEKTSLNDEVCKMETSLISEKVSPNDEKVSPNSEVTYIGVTSQYNQPIEPVGVEEARATAADNFSPFENFDFPAASFANNPELDAALQILRDVTGANGCPPYIPNLHSQTALENTLRQVGYHVGAWRDSCLFWTGNGARNFQKLLTNYTLNKLLPQNQAAATNGANLKAELTRMYGTIK